jgi:hypothetical protein
MKLSGEQQPSLSEPANDQLNWYDSKPSVVEASLQKNKSVIDQRQKAREKMNDKIKQSMDGAQMKIVPEIVLRSSSKAA